MKSVKSFFSFERNIALLIAFVITVMCSVTGYAQTVDLTKTDYTITTYTTIFAVNNSNETMSNSVMTPVALQIKQERTGNKVEYFVMSTDTVSSSRLRTFTGNDTFLEAVKLTAEWKKFDYSLYYRFSIENFAGYTIHDRKQLFCQK